MLIISEKTLAMFRVAGRCEFCLRWCTRREPAHIFSRGTGQIDIPENLVSLGSTLGFQCTCHALNHSGHHPDRADLLDIAATRHGVAGTAIQEAVWRIRRLPKEAGPDAVDAILNALRGHHAECPMPQTQEGTVSL